MPLYPSNKTAARKPTICITAGDPAGIGPEIIKKALADRALARSADFVFFGFEKLKGLSRKKCALASVGFIKEAVDCIKKGRAQALVTGPVSKESISEAGIRFIGQTEYLARLSGSKKAAMMFVSPRLRVGLVTRHVRLADVKRNISRDSIGDAVCLVHRALKDLFGIRRPRIGISGLNPHCGEGGLIGDEEKKVIAPAVKLLRRRLSGLRGPIPADVLLYEAYNGVFDAVVCMYHDQGLAPFKMVARNEGVNLTLGLPFIRTSPDHGTGFDIAGKGIADPGSMKEAIKLAVRLSHAYRIKN
ncbi:MAG: 4-hydroxythreonine-4-phosphate dehydrogenase PdxA [Candidatus Omnitrophota bacterium]